MTKPRILFAPDYRAGVRYQTLLAEALTGLGFEILFQSDYYRGLPLYRGVKNLSPALVHLHWPEKDFGRRGMLWTWIRVKRYPFDLRLATSVRPMVLTAHNLLPHNRRKEFGVFQNIRTTARRAKAVFVHSETAREQMCATFDVASERCHVIPYGDHSLGMGDPMPRADARRQLNLPATAKVCLVFGTVSPYKGSEEIIQFWVRNRIPYHLVIAGPVLDENFANRLRNIGRGCQSVDLRLTQTWLDDDALKAWLSAADCTIFNYREIFTSGAAALARSFGVPILIPKRLTAADLDEPHPHVFRFDTLDTDFRSQLEQALATPCDYNLAQVWRDKTSWERIAAATASVYREILSK